MLRYVRRVLPVLCFLLACVPFLSAAPLIVELKREATIDDEIVRLGDIAHVRGSDSSAAARMGQIELGSSPGFGQVSEWSRRQIQSRIPHSFSSAGLSFEGAPSVQIKRQGKRLNPSDITGALLSYVTSTTQWLESEIQIRAVGNLDGIELPPGDVQLRLASGTTPVGRNRLLVPMETVQEGKTLGSFWITVDVSIHARVLTAARKIPYNKALSLEDVTESEVDIADFRNSYFRRADDLIGKVSRRSFAPGSPLTHDSVTDPFLVRHGETVQLRLERNGIRLTAPAKAEQDGKLGQIIIVRNLEFATALKAQVTGPGAVKIP